MPRINSASERRVRAFLAITLAVALGFPVAPTRATEPGGDRDSVAASPQAPVPVRFSHAELRRLLAPIALYPDALLAQVLAASAYPVQIVLAQRWLDTHRRQVADNDYSGIDIRDWDPAVKALVRFPAVLGRLNADLEWTANLGDAVVNQPQEVAEVIQELRSEAEKSGALRTTSQQVVTTVSPSYIVIEPANPAFIYVPTYDWGAVYQPAPLAPVVTFATGVAVGVLWIGPCWDWKTGAIYPPVWPGYAAWRPGTLPPGVSRTPPPQSAVPPLPPAVPVVPPGAVRPPAASLGARPIGAGPRPWRPGPGYRPGTGGHWPGIPPRLPLSGAPPLHLPSGAPVPGAIRPGAGGAALSGPQQPLPGGPPAFRPRVGAPVPGVIRPGGPPVPHPSFQRPYVRPVTPLPMATPPVVVPRATPPGPINPPAVGGFQNRGSFGRGGVGPPPAGGAPFGGGRPGAMGRGAFPGNPAMRGGSPAGPFVGPGGGPCDRSGRPSRRKTLK